VRALGVTRQELVFHYLSFGALIGLVGSVVGAVLGYFTSFLTMQPFVSVLAGGIYLVMQTCRKSLLFLWARYLFWLSPFLRGLGQPEMSQVPLRVLPCVLLPPRTLVGSAEH
jgi:ABC-type antimicrobial peptide transport system permease subunit